MIDGVGAVHYATSRDGSAIGYRQAGIGPVIVDAAVMGTSIRMRDLYSSAGQGVRAIAGVTLVTYDQRGIGYSDRDSDDCSMDAMVNDLAAVVDTLGCAQVIISAGWSHGPIAMRYAAEFPDRVSHLILNSTSANGADLFEDVPMLGFMHAGLKTDWDIFVTLCCRVALNLDHPRSDEVEAVMRQEASQDALLRHWDAISSYDASPWLGSISSPTLLMQRTGIAAQASVHDSMRQLAKAIPNSALVRSESGADTDRQVQEFIGTP